MDKQIEQRLKDISIRGRMALGISCLEVHLKHLGLFNIPEIERLLSDLWEFTSTNKLDRWDEKIVEYYPESIIDDVEQNDYRKYEFLTKDTINKLSNIFKEADNELSDMIDVIIDIGISNLYSGTGLYSEASFREVIKLLDIMERLGLKIPDISRFERSNFSEFHGWGLRRERAFFE